MPPAENAEPLIRSILSLLGEKVRTERGFFPVEIVSLHLRLDAEEGILVEKALVATRGGQYAKEDLGPHELRNWLATFEIEGGLHRIDPAARPLGDEREAGLVLSRFNRDGEIWFLAKRLPSGADDFTYMIPVE
jgi:hypothetical protein